LDELAVTRGRTGDRITDGALLVRPSPVRGGFDDSHPARRSMDADRLLELVPHYLAMLFLVFLVLSVVRTAVGDIGFIAELAVVTVVVFAYRPIVMRLGVGPSAWE
jgi:hypothetical protein